MTKAELIDLLNNAGLNGWLWQLPDISYEPCSLNFVLENYNAWLEARPVELVTFRDAAGVRIRHRPRWLEEVGDCDNLALGTMMWAQVGNALKSVKTAQRRGGLAYGVLFYAAGPARPENFNIEGGHAINWFVDYDGKLRFFEPGTGVEVDLNTTERSATWFGIAA